MQVGATDGDNAGSDELALAAAAGYRLTRSRVKPICINFTRLGLSKQLLLACACGIDNVVRLLYEHRGTMSVAPGCRCRQSPVWKADLDLPCAFKRSRYVHNALGSSRCVQIGLPYARPAVAYRYTFHRIKSSPCWPTCLST